MPTIIYDPLDASAQIHVGDEGTSFISTIYNQDNTVLNLSTATSLQFRFENPSHDVTDKTAVLLTNGVDGKIIYILEPGFIDEAGGWTYQAIIEIGGGKWFSNQVSFRVYPSIPAPVVPPPP